MSNTQRDLKIAANAYARWSNETRGPALTRRTAERFASSLLPHLTPGMRLLDCGCGPGSITLGLAAAVAPGETIGTDASSDAVERASRFARERAVTNVAFRVADVRALPFDDNSFDAVFANALLQHLQQPDEAVREMARAMKPGGVIALADFDYGGGLIWPHDPALERANDLMGRLHEADGRSPYVGRQLAALLREMGFMSVTPRARVSIETPAMNNWFATARYFDAAPVRDYVLMLGLATAEQLDEIGPALRRWSETPGAVWTRYAWDAVGWKSALRPS